jgi:hypothetical protein
VDLIQEAHEMAAKSRFLPIPEHLPIEDVQQLELSVVQLNLVISPLLSRLFARPDGPSFPRPAGLS